MLLDLHRSDDVLTQHLLQAKKIIVRVVGPSKKTTFEDRIALLDSQKARHVIEVLFSFRFWVGFKCGSWVDFGSLDP